VAEQEAGAPPIHEEDEAAREGVIVIDNTLLPKIRKNIPEREALEPNSGALRPRLVLGYKPLCGLGERIPLGLRQYFKHGRREAEKSSFRSKVELAMDLVDKCERLGVAAENYVFDTWYLARKLAEHVEMGEQAQV